MQISKQEKKINDSVEQLKNLKVELSIVSEDLSQALLNKESVLNEIDKLNKKTVTITNQSKGKLETLRARKIELDNKELGLSMKEDDVKRNELNSLVSIEVAQKKLDDNKKLDTYNLNQLKKKIEEKNSILSDISISVDIALSIEKELKKSIKSLKKDKNNSDKELNKLKDSLSKDISKSEKELESDKKELKELKAQILSEQQVVGSAEKAIKLEHKLLERRKRNLDVMIARFNKAFKEHYPLLELKV